MDLTEHLKIPFPEEEDQGAVALYLETLARKAEAVLGQYEDEADDFLKPPTIVNVSTTTDAINSGFEYLVPFTGNPFVNSGDTVVYSNFPPEWSTNNSSSLPAPGWWAFGASNIGNTMSVVTNNAPYSLILEVESWDITPAKFTDFYRVERNYYESNTAGEFNEIHGVVYVPPGVDAEVRLKMYHQHTGGVVRNIQVGIVTYRTFLGSGDVNGRVGL